MILPNGTALLVTSCLHVAPFTNMVLNLTPAWISNHTPSKMWDEVTYPFINFNGATVDV